MDDNLNIAQKELKLASILRQLLERLSHTVDIDSVMIVVLDAISQAVPWYSIAYIISSKKNVQNAQTIYFFSQGPIGEIYTSAAQGALFLCARNIQDTIKGKKEMIMQLQDKVYPEIIQKEFSEKQGKAMPLDQFCIPLLSNNNLLGIFHIGSINEKQYSKEAQQDVQDIINTASSTFANIENLINKSKAKEQALLECIGDGIVVLDNYDKVTFVNKKALELIGRNEPEILGNSWMIDAPKASDKDIADSVRYYLRKDGSTFPVVVTTSTYELGIERLGKIIAFRDISKEKEIDKTKTEFISIASHQLRTPLGSMRWSIEMLLGEDFGKLPPQIKETVDKIYETNSHMISLVNDLLDVSRIDQSRVADEPQLTSVSDIISDTISEVEADAKQKSVTINSEIAKDNIPEIMLDPRHFREVIENLLSNAIKYNKPEGVVTITANRPDDHIEISIVDTGIGIPQKNQEKLFSKFFRAENALLSKADGSGLGLFVVKSYVEAWGGKVKFESTLGKGTTFTITIPLKPLNHNLDKNLIAKPT